MLSRPLDLTVLDKSYEDWLEEHIGAYWRDHNIQGYLNKKFGKGNWGHDELAQYMLELYEQDRDQAMLHVKETPEVVMVQGSAEERFQHYLEFYEDPAPNDILLLQQMARIEAQLDAIQDKWDQAIQEGDRTASKGWSDIVKNLTGEHRNIQVTLGISRTARDKTKSRADLATYVQDIIRKTSDFVDEHAVPIRCPHCYESPANVEIDMGFILFHFRQDVPWHFEFQCPMCQQTVRLP
jgi:hypothetical protein